MYEIGPLLLCDELNHDIVDCIYHHLIHLKTIPDALKNDIVTYSLLNLITNINYVDREILYDTILFHIVTLYMISNESISISLENEDTLSIIKKLWRKITPNDRVLFVMFIFNHVSSIHINIYIMHL